jgi:hypothetical protein
MIYALISSLFCIVICSSLGHDCRAISLPAFLRFFFSMRTSLAGQRITAHHDEMSLALGATFWSVYDGLHSIDLNDAKN